MLRLLLLLLVEGHLVNIPAKNTITRISVVAPYRVNWDKFPIR